MLSFEIPIKISSTRNLILCGLVKAFKDYKLFEFDTVALMNLSDFSKEKFDTFSSEII